MTDKYSIEIHRRVYDEDNGQYLTVRPFADFPDGNVMLMSDSDQEDYWGSLRLDLPAAMMRKLGEALIAAANEVKE